MLPADPKTSWPPKGVNQHQMRLRAAWYSGDMEALANLYGAYLANPWDGRAAFWGQQARGERRTLVHVPLASDIASVSANLLFGNQPKASCGDEQTEARLQEIIELGQVFNTLIEAADAASGMGGICLKVDWNRELASYPILSIVQADAAVPEFRHGILVACTFWRVLEDDGKDVLRLLERHEPGLILTGLYRGTSDKLGQQIDLAAKAETSDLLPIVQTGIEGLACRYIPNMRPDRKARGTSLGRADTDGCESLMDSLDEVYTSWLRDVRLGRGRIIVPEGFLDKGSDGSWYFDSSREAFVTLNAPIGSGEVSQQITVQQFAIRAAEHRDTALELVSRIVTAAGFSPQTLGLQVQGSPESGAALRLRENRTYATIAAKANYWKAPLEDLLEVMLQVDRLHLGGRSQPERPNIEMQDAQVTEGLQGLAQTVNLINQAQAASVETKIRILHPDWTRDAVDAEVARILDEQGLGVPDQFQAGIA